MSHHSTPSLSKIERKPDTSQMWETLGKHLETGHTLDALEEEDPF